MSAHPLLSTHKGSAHRLPRMAALLLGAAVLASASLAQTTVPASGMAPPARVEAAPLPPAAQALYVRSLAATCANCHGTNGKAPEGAAVLSLAGLPANYIVAQMEAFKSGARPATIMHQLSKGYSDAQVQAMATYFAAQKK